MANITGVIIVGLVLLVVTFMVVAAATGLGTTTTTATNAATVASTVAPIPKLQVDDDMDELKKIIEQVQANSAFIRNMFKTTQEARA